ncbi:MAG TPA: hypothetical protein VN253_16385, partial [Kofleriaceae bacterium]|nr:hypothetical protein [Kofleriaceae bacterium]
MQSRVFPPLVEVFLILEQPRQRLSHWAAALAPLDGAPAPPIATVTAYYDPTCDQALLGMRYDQLALGPERLAYVVEVALRAEIGMIQPSELSDGERDRILGERLARCALSVTDQRTIVNALSELVRRVREQKLGCPIGDEPAPVPKPPPADPIPMLAAARRRRTTQSPRLNVPAKSTRDELSRLRRGHLASPARSPLAKSTRELAREIRVETAKLRAERRLGTD